MRREQELGAIIAKKTRTQAQSRKAKEVEINWPSSTIPWSGITWIYAYLGSRTHDEQSLQTLKASLGTRITICMQVTAQARHYAGRYATSNCPSRSRGGTQVRASPPSSFNCDDIMTTASQQVYRRILSNGIVSEKRGYSMLVHRC